VFVHPVRGIYQAATRAHTADQSQQQIEQLLPYTNHKQLTNMYAYVQAMEIVADDKVSDCRQILSVLQSLLCGLF
jgi:hypothetical protein